MIGRRRRRIYWTVAILVLVGGAGAAIGWGIARGNRPATYIPGEHQEEITVTLGRRLPADAPQPRFSDVTAEAGLADFVAFAGDRSSQLPEDMGPGAAWGDYDGDGDDDLFLVAAGGALDRGDAELAPSRLYENLGDGAFRLSPLFPETRVRGMAAAWGDYDGDGRLDLALSGWGVLRLYRNGGREGFSPAPGFADRPGFWSGLSWADFDRDGDLDLYVCGYVRYEGSGARLAGATRQYGRSVPYTLNPNSFTPERNLLFVNDGRGGFREAAEELGVANPDGRSLGALWHDVDDDGWLDLYIANDISDNALYRNVEGSFEDVSHAAWVADYRGAMGLAAGDWNRDGDDDLFVSHWVAQENALYDSQVAEMGPEQGLRFMDVADQRGLGQIALQRIGWGAEFADFDADGWLDLAVANGSTFEDDGTPKRLEPEPSFLFWNDRGSWFHDLAPAIPALAVPRVSRGLAVADYDMDGDLDLLLVDLDGGVRLLRNEMDQGHWIQLRLRGRAEGARLIARVGPLTLRRAVTGVSYLSQSSRRVHFGLGEAAKIDRLEVRWPSGSIDVHADLEARAIYELVEGEPTPRRTARRLDRRQLAEFWARQRGAMQAMKVDGDCVKAIGLFEQALALDPSHEDSLYYLGNCLAETGRIDEALERFDEMRRLSPMSHRAHKRWGTLLAMTSTDEADLTEAELALERAVEINPEATGALTVLGELALIRGRMETSRERFEWVTRTNPQSAASFYWLGYIDWKGGREAQARRRLQQARAALGEEWKPEGVVAEGDVERQMHTDVSLLLSVFQRWDGSLEPQAAYAGVDPRPGSAAKPIQ